MKKPFLFIIIFPLILLIAFGLYIYTTSDKQTIGLGTTISNIFPFGNETASTTTAERPFTNPNEGNPSTEQTTMPILRKITGIPVGGAGFLYSTDKKGGIVNSTTTFRYIDRATGHVFQGNVSSLSLKKISNTTIPKIQQSLFFNKGNNFIAQYESGEQKNSIIGSISVVSASSSEIGKVTLETLPGTIATIGLSPDNQKIIYVNKGFDGGYVYTRSLNKKTTESIYRFPITEIKPQWINNNQISFTSFASGFEAGFASVLDLKTGANKKVLGDIKGLTTLFNPTNDYVLYSDSSNGVQTFIQALKIGTQLRLAEATLPTKCVWSSKLTSTLFCGVPQYWNNDHTYPDAWYQGKILFSDVFQIIDARTGAARTFNLEREAGQPIDVINPVLSPKEDYLLFTNKIDLSLWGLDLARVLASSTN